MAGHWLAELDGSKVTVEVPASSANLGAGYDCLGVALAITDRIELEVRGLEPGRDRADDRGRGSQRAERGSRQPVRARPRGRPAGGPRRAPRRRRLADLDAQRHPAGARPGLVGGGDGGRDPRRQRARRRGAVDARDAASSPARSRAIPTTRRPRCSAGSSCRRRDGRRVEAIRFDSPARPARRAVHPGAAPADRRDAGRPAGRRPARRRGGQPRGGRGRRRRAGDRSLRPARPADRGPPPRAVPCRGLPAAAAHDRGGPDRRCAGGVPVGRRLHDPGVRRLDGRASPGSRPRSSPPRRTWTWPAGCRSSSRATSGRTSSAAPERARLREPRRRLCGPRPDEREDLVPRRRAFVCEVGRLAVEEAVRRTRVGDQPVVDAGRRRGASSKAAIASGVMTVSAPPNRPRTGDADLAGHVDRRRRVVPPRPGQRAVHPDHAGQPEPERARPGTTSGHPCRSPA